MGLVMPKSLRSIKKYLSNRPALGPPIPGKSPVLYIAAQERSLGPFYTQENEEANERALYYLSYSLFGTNLNYSPIERCVCLLCSQFKN